MIFFNIVIINKITKSYSLKIPNIDTSQGAEFRILGLGDIGIYDDSESANRGMCAVTNVF